MVALVFCPSVMTRAMPRAASIMTSVLMNGWRPTTETRRPLIAPSTTASASASPMAWNMAPTDDALFSVDSVSIATAPPTAIIEPTERSIPSVAMTNVIPSAIMMIGADTRRMSSTLPVSSPVVGLTPTAR